MYKNENNRVSKLKQGFFRAGIAVSKSLIRNHLSSKETNIFSF
jgi:hypothetical protein